MPPGGVRPGGMNETSDSKKKNETSDGKSKNETSDGKTKNETKRKRI